MSQIGQVDDVQITLAAQGSVHADPAEDKNAKPHPLRVSTRLEFVEHVLEIGRDQYVKRSARKPKHAESEIAGEVRPLSVSLRPEISLLIAKRRVDFFEMGAMGRRFGGAVRRIHGFFRVCLRLRRD